MLFDGITLVEGSTVVNLTVASGTTDPDNPGLGELFFRTDLGKLRVYNGSWANVQGSGTPITVASSRSLTAADDGATLECTATVTLTVPAGLPAGFGCAIIPSGTTTIASSGGTLLNGATTSITRTAAANAIFGIIGKTASNSYLVTGS